MKFIKKIKEAIISLYQTLKGRDEYADMDEMMAEVDAMVEEADNLESIVNEPVEIEEEEEIIIEPVEIEEEIIIEPTVKEPIDKFPLMGEDGYFATKKKGWFMEERANCNVFSPITEEEEEDLSPVAAVTDTKNMVKCDRALCNNVATHYNKKDENVCSECMEGDVNEWRARYTDYWPLSLKKN